MSVVRPVMALGWTLNYEMLFYVFFAGSMFMPFNRAIALLTALFVGGVAARAFFRIEQTQLAFWMDPLILEFLFGAYVGIAYRADGSVGARFSDTVNLDLDKDEWKQFTQSPYRYENQFVASPGTYKLTVVLSGGSDAFGKFREGFGTQRGLYSIILRSGIAK